jgi:hypothetical protein
MVVLMFGTCTLTFAQTHIQLYSSFATTGPAPSECTEASAIVTPLIAQFHGPADWTWIIACDEAAWHRIEVHIGQQNSVGGLILGTTDLENHVTYIRGFYVLHPFNTDALAQPDHTIAHELGHITLNTSNETKAERKANDLLNGISMSEINISTHK